MDEALGVSIVDLFVILSVQMLSKPYFCVFRLVNVSLPKKTRKNGTLYAMVFLHQAGMNPWQDPHQVHLVTQLTTYMLPKPPEISLITGQDEPEVR